MSDAAFFTKRAKLLLCVNISCEDASSDTATPDVSLGCSGAPATMMRRHAEQHHLACPGLFLCSPSAPGLSMVLLPCISAPYPC